MATKEDILEQIAEEYLLHEGYFVRHNLKFLPRRDHPEFESQQDSNHSDIDVIGFHPKRTGPERVVVISCKSWQGGFDPAAELRAIQDNRVVSGRERWRAFRELVKPKWSEAFMAAVLHASGERSFTYVLAVTKVVGDKSKWERHQPFLDAIGGNPIQILDLRTMLSRIAPQLSTTLASTGLLPV